MSQNLVKRGSLDLESGRAGDQVWDEILELNRLSWFQEMSLLFDILYFTPDQQSPFYAWFSASEKSVLRQCEKAMVMLTFALDSDRISQAMFKKEMQSAGYERFSILNFKTNLRNHPSFNRHNMRLYTINGWCQKKSLSSGASATVNFAGYAPQNL